METIIFNKLGELRRNRIELENKFNIKIKIFGKKVTIVGDSMDEFEASIVLDAINFGFSAKRALALTDQNMQFKKLTIKDYTRRKNLKDVRARVIGTEGKTKRTIENITGCDMVIHDNNIGIIGSAESIDEAITAIKNLVRGSKQGNVYAFLERMNAGKKEFLHEDLGLKLKEEKE